MHELITQILGLLRGIWRYRWWILGVAWLVSAVGWVVVAKLPDQYQASARVYVDTQSLLGPLLRGLAVQGNEEHRLLLMAKTLLSQPNLEKVMRMADLDLQAKTAEDTEEIIDNLREKIQLASTKQINLYTISYDDEDPELAKLIVKSLLTIFVESNLGETRKEQDSARQFLEQQIADYEQRLVEAESRRTRFQQKNLAFLPGEKGGYYERLQAAQQQLSQAELELKIQQDRLTVLRQQVEGEVPTFGIVEEQPTAVQQPVNPALESRIAGIEEKLDDLLLRYTGRHPDVQALRLTLAKLKKQRDEEIASIEEVSTTGSFSSLGNNPVYQQMRINMAEVEADVAARQAVVDEYKKRIETLSKAVDKVLQVEAESAQLNRDYGLLKTQHQELLARLESARLSHDADTRSGSVRFRIVEPPRVPPTPSGPPRVMLSSIVVLSGLGLGVVLAFFMSQVRPTYDDRRSLNELTGVPVLGSVSMVWTKLQVKKRQRRHLGFLVGLLGLVSVYALVVAVHLMELNIDGYFSGIRKIAGI